MPNLRRAPFGALAIACLVTGAWGGLIRAGVLAPAALERLPHQHGALMAAGFLGALIGLERAIALADARAYLAPAFCAGGALATLLGAPEPAGAVWTALGSLVYLWVTATLARRGGEVHGWLSVLGAAVGFSANAAVAVGAPAFRAAPAWLAFLVITIFAERLELSRLMGLRPQAKVAAVALSGAAAVGAALALAGAAEAGWIFGAALQGIGLWILLADPGLRGLRARALPRYMALLLIAGAVWLIGAGALFVLHGPATGGPWHDAMLHMGFVGFVFSMIFAHGPLVARAVTEVDVAFRPRLYIPATALHATLIVRLTGDALGAPALRQAGATGNVIAIVAFFAAMASCVVAARREAARGETASAAA